jgi:hypothetical protein
MSETREIRLEEMIRLRQVSQKISRFLQQRLMQYLSTLSVFFMPRRLFGSHVQSAFKDPVKDADVNLQTLQEAYRRVCRSPFNLGSKLESPLPAIKSKMELYPWESTYAIENAGSRKTITITSPVKWVLGYSSAYSLSRLRGAVAGTEEKNPEEMKSFLVNSLIIDMALTKTPGLKRILEGLRYTVGTERSPELGELPLTTVSSCIPSFRPQDEMILNAIQLSGSTAFEELVELDAIRNFEDAFKAELLEVAGE